MGSIIIFNTSCTILSFIPGIPNSLVLCGFPAFGISTLFPPVHWKVLFITLSLNSFNLFLVISLIFNSSGPLVREPFDFDNL
jgi:hypothetical protein